MRVLVTGSRDHDAERVSERVVYRLAPEGKVADRITIIHGDARGADQGAAFASTVLMCNEYRFPAEWRARGKAAGMERNREMLDTMKPDLVLAFPLGRSPGTRGCVREAQRRGIPVEVFE